MSDSSTAFWKTLALFLFLALVGVYVLYEWYGDQLQDQIGQKDAQLVESNTQVQDADEQRRRYEALQRETQGELTALKARHAEEQRRLSEELAALKQAKADAEQAMDALKADHAVELEAMRQRAEQLATDKDAMAAADAELKRLRDEAEARAAGLQSALDKVNQAIAATAAEHQAKIGELERAINERISLSRTTPMDADLLRTAREVGVLPAEGAAGAAQQTLMAQLAETKSQLDKTRLDLEGAQSELARKETELADAKASGAGAADAASGDPARQTADLTAQIAEADRVRAALQEQHAAAIAALQQTLDGVQAKLTAAEGELERAKAGGGSAGPSPEPRLAEAQARIETLEASLKEAASKASSVAATARAETDAAISRLRGLYAGLAELGGTYTDRGLLLRLKETDLHFPTSSASLPEGEHPSLDRIAALLSKQPDLKVRIEGHTDSQGSDEVNLRISRQRAEAVREALAKRGVLAERVTAEGKGSALPIADNATPEGRSSNRRVEVYLVE